METRAMAAKEPTKVDLRTVLLDFLYCAWTALLCASRDGAFAALAEGGAAAASRAPAVVGISPHMVMPTRVASSAFTSPMSNSLSQSEMDCGRSCGRISIAASTARVNFWL